MGRTRHGWDRMRDTRHEDAEVRTRYVRVKREDADPGDGHAEKRASCMWEVCYALVVYPSRVTGVLSLRAVSW